MSNIPFLPHLLAFGSFLLLGLALTVVAYFWRDMTRPVRRMLGLHVWRYRNPYDRTCEGCGRHQVEHSRHYTDRTGWWETFKKGNGNLMVCKSKKAKMEAKA